jgi:hypothetical protein
MVCERERVKIERERGRRSHVPVQASTSRVRLVGVTESHRLLWRG